MARKASRKRQAPAPKRKVRVYYDRDIPAEIVRATREDERDVARVVGVAAANMDDAAVWRAAIEADAQLVTHDDGFWNDRKYPLRDSPGVIIVKGRTSGEVLEAMERFTAGTDVVGTERELPGFLRGTKVRATRNGFTIKFITEDSDVVQETYSYDAPEIGRLYVPNTDR
jgi:predicted nuclease of predicted toxin-antitoxin system